MGIAIYAGFNAPTVNKAAVGVAVGKGISEGYNSTVNEPWKTVTENNDIANNRIMNSLPKNVTSNPGGVSQSFQGSFIEDGKWPFTPCYGLLYNYYLLKK